MLQFILKSIALISNGGTFSLKLSKSSSSLHHHSSVLPDFILLSGSLHCKSFLEFLKFVRFFVSFFGSNHVILSFLSLVSLSNLFDFFFVFNLIKFDSIFFVTFVIFDLGHLASDHSLLSSSGDFFLSNLSLSLGFFSLSQESHSSLFLLLESSSSLDSHKSKSSLVSSDQLLLSVVLEISSDLFHVHEFSVITEALFLNSSVWISTERFADTSEVSVVVLLFVSVVLGHQSFKVLNLSVTFVDTIEDNTIASFAPLTFFSASSWLRSWLGFAETLLSHVRSNILTPESTLTFDPSVWSSLSSHSEVRNSYERILLWLWSLVDRVLIDTKSSEPSITNASELSVVVSNVSWALSDILLSFSVIASWISLHLVASSVPVVSGTVEVLFVSLS